MTWAYVGELSMVDQVVVREYDGIIRLVLDIVLSPAGRWWVVIASSQWIGVYVIF